jgi:archaellum component FlaF (FlaF/FlaG flagellin family)
LPVSQKRRGLSSIVGALLFVVLMVATFAVLGVALDSQTEIVDTGRIVADTGLKKQQENFVINTIVQLPSDSLQVNVTNLGPNPTEIFTIVITNSSDAANGYPTQTVEIPSDTSFLPPYSDTPVDIVKTLNLKMKNSPSQELYQFKIISSLGTMEKLFLVCQNGTCGLGSGGGSSGLFAQFLMDGPNGINTKNSTAVMFVTNTGEVPLTDVAPVISCSKGAMFSVSPDDLGTADLLNCHLDPPDPIDMAVGQTAIFKWDGEVAGEIGDVFTFCNQASGTDPDLNTVNSGLVCDDLTVIDPNDCGGCGPGGGDTIILIDDLLIRPALYMIIPSPFGTIDNNEDHQGLWGVNIINPTEKAMEVNKVTIVAYPPASNDNVNLLVSGCPLTMIQPTTSWSCPRANTIMWQNVTHPLTLDPYSSTPFLVKAEPGQVSGSDDVDALIVQANAFTTTGSFGKSDYQSSMTNNEEVIANVFLTSTSESRADIQSSRDTLTELQEATFMVTLADMDDEDTTYISSGAKLIINVPRDWTDVCIDADPTGFVAESPSDPDPCVDNRIESFNDGSTQIVLETNVDIGGGGNTVDARTVTFRATPPENEIPDAARPYIMYVLADGLTGGNYPIGPLNEIALVVQPAP